MSVVIRRIYRQNVVPASAPRTRSVVERFEPSPVGPPDPAPAEASRLSAVERSCISIIDCPPAFGETLEMAHRRKEDELRAVFASLSVTESRDMHRRLANPSEADILAVRFRRMVADRRARLLTFLADARRREAIASARRV